MYIKCQFVVLEKRDNDFIGFLFEEDIPFSFHSICKKGHHHYEVDIPGDRDLEKNIMFSKPVDEEMKLLNYKTPFLSSQVSYLVD
jgi:hypothetical protein